MNANFIPFLKIKKIFLIKIKIYILKKVSTKNRNHEIHIKRILLIQDRFRFISCTTIDHFYTVYIKLGNLISQKCTRNFSVVFSSNFCCYFSFFFSCIRKVITNVLYVHTIHRFKWISVISFDLVCLNMHKIKVHSFPCLHIVCVV